MYVNNILNIRICILRAEIDCKNLMYIVHTIELNITHPILIYSAKKYKYFYKRFAHVLTRKNAKYESKKISILNGIFLILLFSIRL